MSKLYLNESNFSEHYNNNINHFLNENFNNTLPNCLCSIEKNGLLITEKCQKSCLNTGTCGLSENYNSTLKNHSNSEINCCAPCKSNKTQLFNPQPNPRRYAKKTSIIWYQ